MTIKLTIHGTGTGQCSLSGKEAEGIIVTFEDGTLREGFLAHKAFQQLVKMKLASPQAAAPTAPAVRVAAAQPAGNGAAALAGTKS